MIDQTTELERIEARAREKVERLLHLLATSAEGQRLASDLLARFLAYVYVMPASESHHHAEAGGLYEHSLDVALRALGKFEMGFIQEHRGDGTLDNFSSNRNRPRWQYATFVAGLLHDIGKVLDVLVNSPATGAVWDALRRPLYAFCREHPDYEITWRKDRQPGKHAVLGPLLLSKTVTREDLDFMGMERFVQAVETFSADLRIEGNQVLQYVRESDRESTRDGVAAVSRQVEDKVFHFMRALRTLLAGGQVRANGQGAQVYVEGDRAAVVMPLTLNLIRKFLDAEDVALPTNSAMYDMLRDRRLALSDERGHVMKKVRVRVGPWSADDLAVLVLPSRELFDTARLRALRPDVSFEELGTVAADSEPEPAEDGAAPGGTATETTAEDGAAGTRSEQVLQF